MYHMYTITTPPPLSVLDIYIGFIFVQTISNDVILLDSAGMNKYSK